MLPYVQVQLVYMAVSGLGVGLLCRYLTRRNGGSDGPRRRFAAALIVIGGVALVGGALVRFVGAGFSFGGVALAFYGGGVWLPVITLTGFLRRRRVDVVVLLAALILLAVAVQALFIEPNRLQVRRERILTDRLPAGAAPVRIVHVSDLQTVGWGDREQAALDAVNALEPDLVLCSGDYASGPYFDHGPAVASARRFLDGLKAGVAVVVVSGHSEGEAHRTEIFDGLDIVYLRNRGRQFDCGDGRKVYVWGMDIQNPTAPPARAADDQRFRIAVSHVPDESHKLEGRGVDLHLAGHTHGGQVSIPGLGPPIILSSLPRRFARGLHPYGDHALNVCAGIGMEGNHAPPIRFFCPPEICLIELAAP